ncbi:hypothetical protein SAMN05421678_111111 [Actinopolymorpha cephalotaxi]|nr:hypothetical protein SAMN05421678_111111 [Actinopolymorpha cephalotaxi]
MSALTAAIEGALSGVTVLAAPAEGEELFGPHKDIPVSVLAPTPGLLALHSRLLGVLTEAGACFEKAEYVGSGYRPHVTITPQRRLQRGEVVVVGSVSLVDLEPGEDTHQRGVLATIPLDRA